MRFLRFSGTTVAGASGWRGSLYASNTTNTSNAFYRRTRITIKRRPKDLSARKFQDFRVLGSLSLNALDLRMLKATNFIFFFFLFFFSLLGSLIFESLSLNAESLSRAFES